MATEKELRARIGELENEVNAKEHEIIGHMDRIEQLEDQVMRLEAHLSDGQDGKKGGGKGAAKTQMTIELEEKERRIRELKDKMGFLRKEKIRIQAELEKMQKERDGPVGKVIRIEEKKPPLDQLVNELQTKINKQRLLITKLKQSSTGGADVSDQLQEKEDEIAALKAEIEELRSQGGGGAAETAGGVTDKIKKDLTQDLQDKLNKMKRRVRELKQKLAEHEKGGKKEEKKSKKDKKKSKKEKVDTSKFQEKISALQAELDDKVGKIEKLKERVSELKSQPASAGGPMASLTEELQSKLNKAKIQIKSLKSKLGGSGSAEGAPTGEAKAELEAELESQKDIVVDLQRKLDEQKKLIQAKDGELSTVKTEATQHKLKCEDLESQVEIKEQKIAELKAQIDGLKGQSNVSGETTDPHVALRIRELRNLVDELTKQSAQQRLEISNLRNA